MPYIPQSEKNQVDSHNLISTAGQFNYALNQLIANFIDQNDFNYQTANDIVGAMECAKMELYRRLISPYEDKKISENGDVKPYNSF
jgi:hypothetical protein